MTDTDQPTERYVECSFAEFLETVPPNQLRAITDLGTPNGPGGLILARPELQLHCSHDSCNGTRFFRSSHASTTSLGGTDIHEFFIPYTCSNCSISRKTFALLAGMRGGPLLPVHAVKLGEWPPFGPMTPDRLLKLFGDDRAIFLKGRQCENQGLGVGAYSYYRRVVENQKNRILDKIIEIAERVGFDAGSVDSLKAAKNESQFTRALDSVKDVIPESLLVDGKNPLKLLHSALSVGLHERSDQECLEVASVIRLVLGELAERLHQALADHKELRQALGALEKFNSSNQTNEE